MTVLDVHPVGFDTAARVFGEDVAGGVSAVVEVLVSGLQPCAGMAGTDDNARHWAGDYDAGARAAVRALDALAAGGYRLAALLEQCAINYAGAEAACLPGQTAQQSAARWAGVHAARHEPPPGSAGLTLPEPEGWSLLAHLIGRLWPDGHQDLLHTAAATWHSAAATLRQLRPVIDQAITAVADQQPAPETDDAVTVLTSYAETVTTLAGNCAGLGDACTGLATALDHAHSAITHDCADFLTTTIAAETAGGLLAAVTAGLAEAAAQAVVVRAGIAAASAIRATIDAFATVALGTAADLDATAARLTTLTTELDPVLARTTVQAGVTRPGVAGIVEVRPVTDAAYQRLGRFADCLVAGGPAEGTWADLARLERHFGKHWKDFEPDSPDAYARFAALFRMRAIRDHLPMKIDIERNTLRIYDPKHNIFGSYRLDDGMSRTLFRPHRGMSYWKDQDGELVNG